MPKLMNHISFFNVPSLLFWWAWSEGFLFQLCLSGSIPWISCMKKKSLRARLTCLSVLMNHPTKFSWWLVVRKRIRHETCAKQNVYFFCSSQMACLKHGFQKVGSFSLTNPISLAYFLKSWGTLELLIKYWMFSLRASWADLWWIFFFLLPFEMDV